MRFTAGLWERLPAGPLPSGPRDMDRQRCEGRPMIAGAWLVHPCVKVWVGLIFELSAWGKVQ